jgi:RimJ/RimL family protein N-acetyltransferase
MILSTERLTLRHFNDSDLDALHRIWSDPATIWWGAITSIQETKRILSRAMEIGWFAVEHDGVVVGDVFIRPSKHEAEALELGYHFVSSEWGKGFATEACRAVLATIQGQRVHAAIVPENHRSRRVATKLGMTIVGQVIEAGLLHDLWEVRPHGASRATDRISEADR